ncbi:hypothetical protein O7608_03965 [Solwaraspora sp. WMMA2056]|uniref:hypothetical protein n=1 Tax=Solwaraspora sp. WMMA2056 TaxID=3015161 RepID=UPI00259BA084|nr:hypothetical protein [Solwaraspora sp. WMMA2056]WJK41593.1 hypothetical protein O7608_03965 [Solwaraspora sp. WMMA2056]
MYDVVLLTLGSQPDAGCDGGCGVACGTAATRPKSDCAEPVRVPVLACRDALVAAGARVRTVTARSDREIDDVLAQLDGPARTDGLTWPDEDSKTRLVVATASDGQLRAVLRRLVRRYAPPPSRRPADLADNRTLPDLPAIGILPLDPGLVRDTPTDGGTPPGDLAGRLGLPRDPAAVAAAVLHGPVRRLDLLRTDAGSVTLDGALLGGADDADRPLPWRGRVEVDDTVLSAGDEPVLACVVANADGYARLAEVQLVAHPDPSDGLLEVAVAVPVVTRSWWRGQRVKIEVRRARGRAAAVTPRDGELPFVDDTVTGTLTRKRSWWVEPAAWGVYTH